LLQNKYALEAMRHVALELNQNSDEVVLKQQFDFLQLVPSVGPGSAKHFLNRLLGLSIKHQRIIFDKFMNNYDRQVCSFLILQLILKIHRWKMHSGKENLMMVYVISQETLQRMESKPFTLIIMILVSKP
jgi:hypothetical protein